MGLPYFAGLDKIASVTSTDFTLKAQVMEHKKSQQSHSCLSSVP